MKRCHIQIEFNVSASNIPQCVRVCVPMHAHACVCLCMCVCAFAFLCIYVSVCMFVCERVCDRETEREIHRESLSSVKLLLQFQCVLNEFKRDSY